jgi:type 1 glutamine amidotransferase
MTAPPPGAMNPAPANTPAGNPAEATAPPANPTPAGVEGTPEQNGTPPLDPNATPPVANGTGGAPADNTTPPPPPEPAVLDNVLLFSRTAGFRHQSIPAGIQAIQALGAANGFAVDATEDPTRFTDESLAAFDAVIFLSTTTDPAVATNHVLDETQQAAFERYIRAGGGWVGIHSASDTEYYWAWYGQLIGGDAYFLGHPAIQQVTVRLEGEPHVSTEHLPATFQVTDELYSFRQNPRASVTVLMTLDESTYNQEQARLTMGDHPISWYHEFDGGRAWYTGLGHTNEMFADPRFTQHVLGGIRWAAGAVP